MLPRPCRFFLALSACITPPANDDLPVPGMSLVSLGPTDLSGAGSGGNAAYVGRFDGLVGAYFNSYTASFTEGSVILDLNLDGEPLGVELPYVEELGAYALIGDGDSIIAYAYGDADNPNALVVKVVFQTGIDDFTLLKKENSFQNLIGNSDSMHKVFDLIQTIK